MGGRQSELSGLQVVAEHISEETAVALLPELVLNTV